MSIQRTLQKYMDDWKAISNLDFCLITDENEIFVTTCSRSLPSEKKLSEFRESNALIMANTSRCFIKFCIKKSLPIFLLCGEAVTAFPPLENWLSARYRAFWKPMRKKMTKTLLCKSFFLEIIRK